MPYVTESTKVNAILPVTVHEAAALTKFLSVYEKVMISLKCYDRKVTINFRIALKRKKMSY